MIVGCSVNSKHRNLQARFVRWEAEFSFIHKKVGVPMGCADGDVSDG